MIFSKVIRGNMNSLMDEKSFYTMSENNYIRRAQIPIRQKKYDFLVKEYSPDENDRYVMFHHPGHFLIYDSITRYCIYDATYIRLPDKGEDAVAFVITEIKINKDEKCFSDPHRTDDFGLLIKIFDNFI